MLAFYRENMESIMPGHYCIFGHVGDGHPHVNMLSQTQDEFEAGTAALMVFARKAVLLGGSVAAACRKPQHNVPGWPVLRFCVSIHTLHGTMATLFGQNVAV